LFAAEGADLVLLDIGADIPGVPYPLGSASQLALTERLCRERGAVVLPVQADIRDEAAVGKAVATAVERFGRLDAVVNAAGIVGPSGRPVHETTAAQWQVVLDVNLSGAWHVTSAAGRIMAGQRFGSIVNVASTAGLVGYRHFCGYVASKHGLVGLTKAAALDLAPLKVRVNALCPGSIRDSEQLEGVMLSEIARALDVPADEHEETFLAAQPMNALVEPEDVAAAALWLADDESRHVTGSTLVVDGGFTVR
jgi:NAD(P)-dependent dehydrogenase (short-subunit alcohol dehydrogenase family)